MNLELQRAYGRIGGFVTRSRHSDPAAKARQAFEARFYRDVPGDLPQGERDRRALAARRAYFAQLAARSAAARAARRVASGYHVHRPSTEK